MDDKTALVVIDTQLGMFETPGVPPVPNGERLLEKIGGLIREAREAGVAVIHIRHGGEPGHPLEKGTDGWQIHPRVAPLEGEPVVDKETPDSFLRTTLAADAHGTWAGERLSVEQVILHHNEVLGNGFASVVPSDEISFIERVKT